MDAPSIKPDSPSNQINWYHNVCLGKVSAHTKEEEKKEKTEFHPPYSQNKNKKLSQ
jgi:hypothetical protein